MSLLELAGRDVVELAVQAGWRSSCAGSIHRSRTGTPARAGLPTGTRFHHLRHHYASVLIDGGESVKVVQERLGHASAVETLKTYSHLFPSSDERTRSVVEAAWAPAPADSPRRGN